jgi:Caspase domain
MKGYQIPIFLLTALALAGSCSRRDAAHGGQNADRAQAQAGAAQAAQLPPSGGASGKRALLIGINKYKYPDRVSPLAGAVNDVEDMKALLTGKFEFAPENILLLKDEQATHAGIIAAIKNDLIAKTQKDDIVVFHFSGHGSQMKDVTNKRISGLDETIVPYDSRDPAGKVFDISGAELHGLLLQLAAKTKNITFILDSCHSGTLIREASARVRGIPADDRTPPSRAPEYALSTRGLGQTDDTSPIKYAFIAAATSRENAFEHVGDGKEHGALTYFLARQFRQSGAGVTYRDVMDNVIGNVTANYPAQHPRLEGVLADEYVFGDRTSLAQSYVLASPAGASTVSLAAGQVYGATVGSIYDVYKPGTKKFRPPEKPIAQAQVTAVGPFTAEAKLVSGAKILQFSRAVERQHRYPSRRLRVYFDNLDGSPSLQAIKAACSSLPVEAVTDKALCHMQIRESGGRVITLAADATTLSTPVSTRDPNLVDRLTSQIRGWAKWFNVLSLTNPQPELEVRFSIKASQTRDPFQRLGKPDAGLMEGEKIDATIQNMSTRDIYVSILDLSSDGSIEVVYPPKQGSSPVLQPGLTFTTPFNTWLPKGRSIVTDVLKVFASTKPVDLTPVTQGRPRDPDQTIQDPLADLLEDASGVSRNVTAAGVETKPVNLGGWTTAQRVLVVKKR